MWRYNVIQTLELPTLGMTPGSLSIPACMNLSSTESIFPSFLICKVGEIIVLSVEDEMQ